MDQDLKDRIVRIIDKADDMTIATVRPDGFPQATTVSFVNDGITIYFGTGSEAQKAHNIAANNKVSLTIDLPYQNWDSIVGLSIGGYAHRITDGDEQQKVAKLMFDKFPQIGNYISSDGSGLALFRVDPVAISILDYTKGFGHTELVTV